MRVTILGKRWNFRRVNKLGPKTYGECDPPDKFKKELRVLRRLYGQAEMETILHEMLHAADWTKDEAWIDEVASDIAKFLYKRLGYRIVRTTRK